jgi:hypothetical protein
MHLDQRCAVIDALRAFALKREVEHCGHKFEVSPFDLYATCPHCGHRLKLRSFSAGAEIEDIFDAVFDWLRQPGAAELLERRQAALAADEEE